MRIEKTIDLGDARTVTVRELRVGQVRQALAQAKGGALDIEMGALLAGDLGAQVARLGDCIEFGGGTLDDLTFGELTEIWDAFREVNSPFFALLAQLGLDLGLAPAMAPSSATSTASAAPSSSADTSASGTTDGDFS